jgi:hypothetical protein
VGSDRGLRWWPSVALKRLPLAHGGKVMAKRPTPRGLAAWAWHCHQA